MTMTMCIAAIVCNGEIGDEEEEQNEVRVGTKLGMLLRRKSNSNDDDDDDNNILAFVGSLSRSQLRSDRHRRRRAES